MSKYTTGLVKEVREKQEQQQEQEKLKKKHSIEDENVVVVEKSNMAKFTVNTVKSLFKLIATICLLCLACVGLMTLIYPHIRQEFLKAMVEIMNQIKVYLNLV